ncbi:MAG: hypothetical protein HC873_03615 [Leptolyngbyaceae cyanobacterium SL_1_1]|nr:hypothetical protein [Leptolyngbyaceae cyanobacterium RM1_1_2]NJO08887.1 hypothetical protein [Leptolyngbyaceae cyanobacterium SL_1_1]
MKSSQLKNTALYLLCLVMVPVVMVAIRVIITWSAERYIYSVPWVGGLLKSLEIAELANVVVFALLGLGLGAATIFLPKVKGLGPRVAVLLLVFMLAAGVFGTGYLARQHLWIQQVADQSNISSEAAKTLADNLLVKQTGDRGFWGFYRYTTQVPVLPTEARDLQTLAEEEKWVRSELTRFSGVEPGVFSKVFHMTGWGIRIFYMLLAAITVLIYFLKGTDWAESQRPQPSPRPIPRVPQKR